MPKFSRHYGKRILRNRKRKLWATDLFELACMIAIFGVIIYYI